MIICCVPSYECKILANKKAEVISSALSSMLMDLFAQPKWPTIMPEG
jgi:hypothetical protein